MTETTPLGLIMIAIVTVIVLAAWIAADKASAG